MQNNKKRLNYYAKILIFFSFGLMFYGFVLDFYNDKKLINPIEDVVSLKEEKNTVSITTIDGNEVVPGNKIVNSDDGNNSDNFSLENNNSSSNSSIDEVNDKLRESIQDTYGITIKFGRETIGYEVGGFSTTPVNNSFVVNSALNRLNKVFLLYPEGFFYEIKKGGIPLTIILINKYSDNSITGVTDSSFTYADISIALSHPFEESFYHESYHYIERYILKKGGNFNSWNSLNPNDFKYGTIINNFSYDNTFAESSYFVNNYAQSAEAEDRASTFECMMADSEASCLNHGKTVWRKANLIKNTLEAVFSTVSPNITEYWERFI